MAAVVVGKRNLAGDEPALQELEKIDERFPNRVVSAPSKAHGRVVLSPCGDLVQDNDDVRRVGEAAAAGAIEALAMGASNLSLQLHPEIATTRHPADGETYQHAGLVAKLFVRQATYASSAAKRRRLEDLKTDDTGDQAVAGALEEGRILARVIGAGDPEEMAPPKLAATVEEAMGTAGVSVEVVRDLKVLEAEYPLLHAVARASIPVERHHPCVVRLDWSGSGPIERTICIAGKGVTYDTGGADVKAGGIMAGMRRDKCGAAAAAGFVLACAKAPAELTKGLRVIAELGCVRNSIGAESYVADEVLKSHAGFRVLVANTDCEGRLVLADCLSHLRERVLQEKCPRPTLLSLATLTGHAVIAYNTYAVALDNAAARSAGGVAAGIAAAGTLLGEPVEVGRLRREDFSFVAPGTSSTPVSKCPDPYDVLQSNTSPSSGTPRGHQFPMAFLCIASGLQSHGPASPVPLPYCHIDLADSIVDPRGVETGSPIVPLFGHFVMGIK